MKRRYGLKGILAKTALFSWLITIITVTVFVVVTLPSQRRSLLEDLESKARAISVSLHDIATGAVVAEEYNAVAGECMEVLSGDETIEFLVLTRNDGLSLIHTPDGWKSEQKGNQFRSSARETWHGIGRSDILDKEVFQYVSPFDDSGIEWGWIHVGLSLDSYRTAVKVSRTRTAGLALLCIFMGLVASVVYAKRMVTPILKLSEAVRLVTEGDLNVRARIKSGDEVEALGDAFNAMTQALQDREARVLEQNRQLATLVTDKALHAGNLSKVARQITEASAETLGVERVGVWLFNDDKSTLECMDQFTLGSRTHKRGARINRAGHETYFSALESVRAFTATDAFTDDRSACLVENYLRPLDIYSLMDAAIRVGGHVVGVICHEHVGGRREWTLEEENFAGSLADLLALALEARDRSAAQDEVIAAKEAAEAASDAKSQFLANMSHEIRTPVNGMMGMLQLLHKHDLPDQQKHFVAAALSSADTLLTVIGDVLDFSRIEAGHLDLDHADFELRDAIDRAVRLFADKAEAENIELSYIVDPELPDKLVGDSNRLQQVLINLVGNAMKFTEAGEIHLECRLVERSDTDAVIRVSVRDSGPGIPPEQRESIFQSFAQGDASMRRRYGGSGLGLAISRNLVGLMGGEISVESRVGEGSKFWFTSRLGLQREAPDKPEEQTESTRGPSVSVANIMQSGDSPVLLAENLRNAPDSSRTPPVEPETGGEIAVGEADEGALILLVEDNPINMELAHFMIRNIGHRCDEAEDGQEAVEAVKRHDYDLVLMDCQMPGTDGYEATTQIRAWESASNRDRRVPIVAVTAHAMKEDRERCLACGMDDYMTKPVEADLLEVMISKWLGQSCRA